MIRLTQKTFTTKDTETPKTVAYVQLDICLGGKTYFAKLPDTKKREFNAYCKSLGFVVGEVDSADLVSEKVVEK